MRRHCLAVAALALLTCGCGAAPGAGGRHLVVLAVDGLDPEVTERMIREGRVPHLAELARNSGVLRVSSTPGAESASAWASFATGVNPGSHGVFDTIAPDPATRRPSVATLRLAPPSWIGRWWPARASYERVRTGDPFWTQLGAANVRTAVLFVPGTFPPEPIPGGIEISGTPLPDWSGGLGSGYTWLASDVAPTQVGATRYGGRVEKLTFSGNVARATLVGLQAPERLDLPLTITWNPEARSANIDIGDQSVYLAEGQRSRWIEVSLRLGRFARVSGLVRMHLVKAGNDVQLYVSPIQWHPRSPPAPISSPSGAAAALFDRLGPYRTLAWPDTGWALADGWISDDVFLAGQEETFTDRAETLLNHVESGNWDLIVAGIGSLATTERLMWRFIDPGHASHEPALVGRFSGAIAGMYQRLDELVGQVRERLPEGADMVVVSAYGVYTARHLVDLNRWLTTEGLLVWREPPEQVTLAALADPSLWDDVVDWTQTSARAMGAGHIYLNLRGRDPAGIVDPGTAADALLETLEARLSALTDPVSGRGVVARVRAGRTVFSGPLVSRGPDLIVTFSPGYRVSWDTMLGGLSDTVIAPNRERWSAEHASVDEATVPGVWLSSMPLSGEGLSVLDVAPSLLQYFEQRPPPGMEGSSRLAPRP